MNSINLLSLLVTLLICSSSKANPLSRIVNGHKAENYQFPWHVSLRVTTTTVATYCGGTLIGSNFILTAASCLRNAITVQVDIGSIVFNTPFETQHTTQFLSHPQFNEDYKVNNIALLRLPTTVVYRNNIRSILLPRLSDIGQQFEAIDSYVSGFGVTEANGTYLSNDLYFAHKTVIPNANCTQSFDSRYIPNSVMCARGYNGTTQTMCYGDQGGALVVHVEGAWVQIGVASLIHQTGCTGIVPAVYTRVSSYLEWISSMTGIPLRP